MTEEFALAYIKSRQRQLGYDSYDLDYRQLVLRPGERITISAVNQLYLLTSADEGVRVLSSTGQYYARSQSLSEQKYDHSGQMIVQNNDPAPRMVTFVVARWRQQAGASAPAPVPPAVVVPPGKVA